MMLVAKQVSFSTANLTQGVRFHSQSCVLSGTFLTIFTTKRVRDFHQYIGSNNALFLLFAYSCNCILPGSFLYVTSFIHYWHYICTYYYRKQINFGLFKRTVILFKAIALLQIIHIYFEHFELVSALVIETVLFGSLNLTEQTFVIMTSLALKFCSNRAIILFQSTLALKFLFCLFQIVSFIYGASKLCINGKHSAHFKLT